MLAVQSWLDNDVAAGKQVFRLFGVAGTGKSTLAKHLAEAARRSVQFCAYTGKAAQVMRTKGCHNAKTIHSLIYIPREKSKQRLKEMETELLQTGSGPRRNELKRLIKQERDALAQPAFTLNTESEVRNVRLLILDECSMVDSRIGQDLLSFGVPILVIGDPEQLPPVKGSGFFTSQEPDVMLDEIHRQARDNPIIRLATDVREGRGLRAGDYGDSAVLAKPRPSPDLVMAADQVLCGRNITRRGGNSRARALKGFESEYPQEGDRLVCLRNNYDDGLLNGTLWNCLDVGDIDEERLVLTVRSDDSDDVLTGTEVHAAPFRGEDVDYWSERDANKFDYGYMLTVHKAQGSQWKSVVLFNESFCFRQDARRWLYTGITRASEKITIVPV